ncbi:hypothetical protein [uncultured Cohaesibacter sp.]|uniref:hypothetical protein n=1 Tax=uncultured Cohaesibacter sp. TaxID=1002546 RepID=UPI0029C7F9E8|nr:hypothetical protein [uncultured Cohaesibacter sp.]
MGKSVPFSVRLTSEDADYVAALQIPEALTPSDKIRHIISESRKRSESQSSFSELAKRFEDDFLPTINLLRQLEYDAQQESEILHFFADWLSLACAEFAKGPRSSDDLQNFEARVVRQAFKLIEQTIRMAITSDAPCYDPSIIRNGCQRTIELVRLIKTDFE